MGRGGGRGKKDVVAPKSIKAGSAEWRQREEQALKQLADLYTAATPVGEQMGGFGTRSVVATVAANHEDASSGRGKKQLGPSRTPTFKPTDACTVNVLHRSSFPADLGWWGNLLRGVGNNSTRTATGKGAALHINDLKSENDFARVFAAQQKKRAQVCLLFSRGEHSPRPCTASCARAPCVQRMVLTGRAPFP